MGTLTLSSPDCPAGRLAGDTKNTQSSKPVFEPSLQGLYSAHANNKHTQGLEGSGPTPWAFGDRAAAFYSRPVKSRPDTPTKAVFDSCPGPAVLDQKPTSSSRVRSQSYTLVLTVPDIAGMDVGTQSCVRQLGFIDDRLP